MFWSSILPNLMTQSTTFQWSYPESSRQHLDMSLIQIMSSFVLNLSLRHTWHHTSSSWSNLSSRLLLWGIWKVSLLCTELCSRLKVFIKVWLRAEKVPQQPRREPQNTVWMAMKGFSLSSPLLSMHLLMQKVSLFCVKYSTYFIEDKFRCFIDQWPGIVQEIGQNARGCRQSSRRCFQRCQWEHSWEIWPPLWWSHGLLD